MFKWNVSRIFAFYLYNDSNPAGPLTNRLKYFPTLFKFCRDIRGERG